MSEEEFKSPLPPRMVETEVVEAPTEEPVISEPLSTEPTARVDMETATAPVVAVKTEKKPKLWGWLVGGLVAIAIVVAAVVILGKKNIVAPKMITLNYWGLWEDSNLLSSLIADYEAKNPGIKINYVRNQITDYRSRLQSRLESKTTGDDTPDIFRIHGTWLPEFGSEIAPVPDSTVTNLSLDKDFYGVYGRDLKKNGNFYAIPLMYDGLGLYYNKDIISTAGAKLPQSWWDLQETAKQLTVRDTNGQIQVAGLAAGLTDNVDHWSDILSLLIKQNGGDILVSGDVANDDSIRDAMVYYANFKTLHQVWDESLPSSTEMFAQGKLAFYFAPSWRVFDLEKLNPNLHYEIMSVPQLPTLKDVPKDQAYAPANLTNINLASYWVEAVNSKSDKQKEAWKFLEYLASKEGLEKLYQAESQSRSFGEIYPRKSMADELKSNTKVSSFLSVADISSSSYMASRTFDDGLDDQMSKYFADGINSLELGTDADKVMTTVRSGINQLITRYSLNN